MTKSGREIWIGTLAVVLFAVLTVWLSARDTDEFGTTEGVYRLTAQFNRIDGLLPGDDVRLSGVRIGVVEKQSLDERFNAVLTLLIDDSVVLTDDTSAAIHTNGLFGSKFVVLESGGGFDNLVDGDEITYTQDALVVEDLLELIISEGKAKRAGG